VDTGPAPPIPSLPSATSPKPVPPEPIPTAKIGSGITADNKIPTKTEQGNAASAAPEVKPEPPVRIAAKPQRTPPKAAAVSPVKLPVTPAKIKSPLSRPKQASKSKFTTPIVFGFTVAAAILVVSFFFARQHNPLPAAKSSLPALAVAEPAGSASTASVPSVPAPVSSAETATAPEPSPPVSSDTAAAESPVANVPPAEGQNPGALVIVAGQDNAKVLLNGKPERRLTQAGQLRLPNLEPRDYVVQVIKSGFQDPPAQKIRIRNGEETKLFFTLQPKALLASLAIQGGTPGTAVLVDQAPVGTIQPDGTLSVSTVSAGDHTIELRKDRFKTRQFKKHFVAGGTISLAAADAALEAVPGELKITFSPGTANVAIAKGDLLKIVSSGVPLNLAAGTYTLTARTAERFTRSATLEVVAGQSKALDLSLAPNGMSKWDDPGAWKQEKDAFIRKGGDFVLYGVAPTTGTFLFSAIAKGRLLQWVLNYSDPKNYVLFQVDDKNFYRSVIRNGQKADEIIVPHKGDKKSFRTFQIRVSRSELIHEIKDGESWTVLDRWTRTGANLAQGKFGFYIPGNEQIEVSSFAHYADLNIR
jgi:hypothetical protein